VAKGEIKVVYPELRAQIVELNKLESKLDKGSGFGASGGTEYLNFSNGGMCDAVNESARQLQEIEAHLREVVQRTKKVMINAGVNFEYAEEEVVSLVQNTIR
jgi:hypothetical protein